MFRIRRILDSSAPANQKAIKQVQEILRAQFAGLEAYEIDSLPAKLNDPLRYRFQSRLLVAERNDRVRGFAMLLHVSDLNFCILDFIAAGKGMTGRGLGGALYGRVREEARNLGVKAIFMECLPDDPALSPDPVVRENNAKRLAFYEKYGAYPLTGTLYETPLKEGDTDPPYLVLDPMGRECPPISFIEKAARAILERKYGDICPTDYIEAVVESFRSGEVTLRQPKYAKRRSNHREDHCEKQSGLILFANEGHQIHHVRERGYVESPIRVKAIMNELESLPSLEKRAPSKFSDSHILAVHDPDYYSYLKQACAQVPAEKSVYPYVFPIRNATRKPDDTAILAGYYCIDTFTPINVNAFTAAREAVDCALSAAEAVLESGGIAYALVRPPGHHAERRSFGGFCYLSNTAIAAHYLSNYGTVAILDVDYHHGNGQQDIFYRRNDVLTVSLHGHPRFAYPYFAGFPDEHGEGAGYGYNVNFALPEKLEAEDYLKHLSRAIKKIREFNPSFLVVALGLDTAKSDPTGTWNLSSDHFRQMGARIGEMQLPTVVVQEGGYRTKTLGVNARNFFASLLETHAISDQKNSNKSVPVREKKSSGRRLRDKIRFEDIEQIGDLTEASNVFSDEEVRIARELAAESVVKGEEQSGYSFLLMEEEGRLIGYACYGKIPLTESSFDLYWLVVAPDYQRKGIATTILESLESRIRQGGRRSIYVETSSTGKYDSARSFYSRHSYKVVSEYPDFYKPGDGKVTLCKTL